MGRNVIGRKGRAIPAVILASSTPEKDLTEGYRLGVNSYLEKPVDYVRLQEAVRQLEMYWMELNQPPPGSSFTATTGTATTG